MRNWTVENIAEERCDVVILPPVADEPRCSIKHRQLRRSHRRGSSVGDRRDTCTCTCRNSKGAATTFRSARPIECTHCILINTELNQLSSLALPMKVVFHICMTNSKLSVY